MQNTDNAIREKENLLGDLNEIFALMDVVTIVLRHESCTELESLIEVSAMASNGLYIICEELRKEITCG